LYNIFIKGKTKNKNIKNNAKPWKKMMEIIQIQEYNNSLTTNKVLPFINENQRVKKKCYFTKRK
jgi:hypothetical protein